MVEGFDRIVLGVPDLAGAVDQLAVLLGATPCEPPYSGGPARAWLDLSNTVLELVQRDADAAAIEGLVLLDRASGEADSRVGNPLGLDIALCDGSRTARFRSLFPGAVAGCSVDHLVVRSADAQACIALFGMGLGIRLALDRTAPEWGGRMLFFRAGGMTLEVIEPRDEPVAGTAFWGVAYRHPDLDALCASLAARGVRTSAVREGRKPGTRVATVKSHCLGIPTLLIEPGGRVIAQP
ncbi:MAG: VOC family protein [Halioglobus sp.]|nr:VOC family protein [Halioglobus sp.]